MRAFTLLEIIITLGIITVLATLVISVATRAVFTGRESQARAVFQTLDQVLDTFAAEEPLRSNYKRQHNNAGPTFKDFFGKYPPTRVPKEILPNTMPTNSLADADLYHRITGRDAPANYPLPAAIPDARIYLGTDGNRIDNNAGHPARKQNEAIESFVFYVNYYSPTAAEMLRRLPPGTIVNRDVVPNEPSRVGDWVDLNDNGEGDEGDFDLSELVDGWGNTILYLNSQLDRFDNISYQRERPDGRIDNLLIELAGGRPVFVSAGPDGYFSRHDIPRNSGSPVPENAMQDNVYSVPKSKVDALSPENLKHLENLLTYDHSRNVNNWAPRDYNAN